MGARLRTADRFVGGKEAHLVLLMLLARPAASKAGLFSASVSLFLIYLFLLYLTISVRSVISTFIGLIFAKFPDLIELWLAMSNLELVFRFVMGHKSWQPNFGSFIPHNEL